MPVSERPRLFRHTSVQRLAAERVLPRLSRDACRASGGWVQRFTPWQVFEHGVLIVTFTGLALTGLPQKYAQLGISRWAIGVMGGIEAVRAAHHILGFALLGLGVVHVAGLVVRGWRYGFSSSMWPGRKDFQDLLGTLRHYLDLEARPPRFGRYSFKEKFEYWALVWGTVVMGLTGLILLYPEVATRFFPGVVVPAARAAHGGEAVLAVVAVLVWHMYNAHLRPEVFPLDTVIFTGRMPYERWAHEHPLEAVARVSGRGDSGPSIPAHAAGKGGHDAQAQWGRVDYGRGAAGLGDGIGHGRDGGRPAQGA